MMTSKRWSLKVVQTNISGNGSRSKLKLVPLKMLPEMIIWLLKYCKMLSTISRSKSDLTEISLQKEKTVEITFSRKSK